MNARGVSDDVVEAVLLGEPRAKHARLLPQAACAGSTYERKIREIIQSIRLTQAFPGDSGKQQIITAYLNQNFYGNQSYGVKAAAQVYFGKALKDRTNIVVTRDPVFAAAGVVVVCSRWRSLSRVRSGGGTRLRRPGRCTTG